MLIQEKRNHGIIPRHQELLLGWESRAVPSGPQRDEHQHSFCYCLLWGGEGGGSKATGKVKRTSSLAPAAARGCCCAGTCGCWHSAGQAAVSWEEPRCHAPYGGEVESASWLSYLISFMTPVLPGAFRCGAAFFL